MDLEWLRLRVQVSARGFLNDLSQAILAGRRVQSEPRGDTATRQRSEGRIFQPQIHNALDAGHEVIL